MTKRRRPTRDALHPERPSTVIRGLFLASILVRSIIGPAFAGSEEDAVRHLLHRTFDSPTSPLIVDPVVIADIHAIAGWTQRDMGGRALLQRKQEGWTIVLCAGDAIKSSEALRQAGLPADIAATIAAQLETAEKKVEPDRIAKFSRFEGLIRMDETGHHPPASGQRH